MKLDTLNWSTITKAQAVRLRVAAAARQRAVARKFEADQATEAELLAACELEENLQVFALTGECP